MSSGQSFCTAGSTPRQASRCVVGGPMMKAGAINALMPCMLISLAGRWWRSWPGRPAGRWRWATQSCRSVQLTTPV